MADRQAYNGEITLAFNHKESVNSSVKRLSIESERINYVMIESMYECVNVLPVIFLSVRLSSDMYTKVVDTNEYSTFYLKIRKKNALTNTGVYKTVIEDTFTYVTSSQTSNASAQIDAKGVDAYKTIMIGLVSEEMTNILRTSFNGIFNDTSQESMVDMALETLPTVIKAPLKYNEEYKSLIIPPITSRYKLLTYLFDKEPFYDTMFTFFMDFNNTYLIPKNGEPVDAKNGTPSNVIVDIKNFSARDAYEEGFSITNGAYLVKINANDVNMIVNNATSKVTNNIIGYYDDYESVQNLDINNNNTVNNTVKTSFIRSSNAAKTRNELEGNSVIIELLKQNLDADIFTPNKAYAVSNYADYDKYDGSYYLSYKREFYYPIANSLFMITSTIGLKKAADEEAAKSVSNVKYTKSAASSGSAKKRISSSANNTASSSNKKADASSKTVK